MEFKYCQIKDIESASIDELKQEIARLKLIADERNNAQLGAKLFINSVYGALANQYYSLSNTDIAESITLQGQNLIKYAVEVVNAYFRDSWHEDIETHKLIARDMKEKYPDFNVEQFMNYCKEKLYFGTTLQCAGDTDSAYISFQLLCDSCHIELDKQTQFLMFLYEEFLEDYLDQQFKKYAVNFNCPENIEEFALEKIFRSGIFLAKKKYVGDIAWKEPDIFVDPLHKVVYKGVEVIQGSTPKFCRDKMKEFIKFMLDNINKNKQIDYKDIIDKIYSIKEQFVLQSPDEMCKTFNVNDYEKYILEDKARLVFVEKSDKTYTNKDGEEINRTMACPIHVRGAAIYNNMLYTKAKRWKTKYNIIKKGDKVKFYYAKDKNYKGLAGEAEPVFSFLPNNFPLEFAPAIDTDKMFEKLILDPLNRIIVASGYPPVPVTLVYASALF